MLFRRRILANDATGFPVSPHPNLRIDLDLAQKWNAKRLRHSRASPCPNTSMRPLQCGTKVAHVSTTPRISTFT